MAMFQYNLRHLVSTFLTDITITVVIQLHHLKVTFRTWIFPVTLVRIHVTKPLHDGCLMLLDY